MPVTVCTRLRDRVLETRHMQPPVLPLLGLACCEHCSGHPARAGAALPAPLVDDRWEGDVTVVG